MVTKDENLPPEYSECGGFFCSPERGHLDEECEPKPKGKLGRIRKMHQALEGESFCMHCGLPHVKELWAKYSCDEEWKQHHRVYVIRNPSVVHGSKDGRA